MQPLDRLLSSTQTPHAEVDVKPARRPMRVTLEGAYTKLVPLDASRHARDLYEPTHGAERENLFRYLWDRPSASEDDFRAALERKAATDDPLFFAITDLRNGRALGYASYMRIEPANRCIEVGSILFAPELQRTCAATEAMYLMARHAFEDLGYRRYEWKCDSLNRPSIRAALRLGFTFEGVFRQHMIVKGHNRDTAWFSMLDSEWPARKAAFERWLSADNFDAAGRQKNGLAALR
jgi:RimJ/RimL family protein N-acetyltransferase